MIINVLENNLIDFFFNGRRVDCFMKGKYGRVWGLVLEIVSRWK